MSRIRKRRPSPATVISIIALVFALVGTAVAGVATVSVLSKKEKKQTKKIANNAIKAAAPGLSVAHAANATSADSATNAANANAVDGVSIVPIDHRSNNVTNAVFATAGELTFRVSCTAGTETITATTTNALSSEITVISNDAAAADNQSTQIRGNVDDVFDDTDTFAVGPDGGDSTDRQYNVIYSSDGGQNVIAQFVTEDSVDGNNCTVSGFALVG